jgi:hypothetical protein
MSGRETKDFNEGKIYKIYSPSNPDLGCYYGSTCIPLNCRLMEHKNAFRKYINHDKPIERSRAVIQFGDAVIELVEKCPCSSRAELEKRERFYIQSNPDCLNAYHKVNSR